MAASQLQGLGFTRRAIQRRLDHAHRGVHAVGHPRLTERGRWMAAVLASGAEAVLSHHQAVALRGLRRGATSVIHVTAPVPRKAKGVTCHTARSLRGRPRLTVDGIPVTRRVFETDRRRGNILTLANVTLLRFTDRDRRDQPRRFVAEIRQAIRACRSAGAAASGR